MRCFYKCYVCNFFNVDKLKFVYYVYFSNILFSLIIFEYIIWVKGDNSGL